MSLRGLVCLSIVPALLPGSGALAQEGAGATVVIVVPEGARLYFDGQETRQTGSARTFTTPPLRPGTEYTYQIRAEVNQQGEALTQTRQITVRASETTRVDLGNLGTVTPRRDRPEASAAGDGWPWQWFGADAAITMYQPQVEKWDANRLETRAVVAVETQASPQPTFGVMHITARAVVDRANGLVSLDQFQISRADFPTAPDRAGEYVDVLRQNLPSGTQTVTLEHLQANQAVSDALAKTKTTAVKSDPPQIIFSTQPAVLVRSDGPPVLRQAEGSPLLRVANTRALILNDPAAGKFYLHLMDRWMEAPKVEGPWSAASPPPPALDQVLTTFRNNPQVDLLDHVSGIRGDVENGALPAVHVSTKLAELITTDGTPRLAPIEGTELQWVMNSPDAVFHNPADQHHYVLLSGRWFRAPSWQGPWEFVPANRLPADFARIPETHPRGDVLASVPGTPQAREARIANQVPQTATIRRREAMLNPVYDGAPRFVPTDGTPLQYAANSPTPVIRINARRYYAAENGVWFTAGAPTGPWEAADSVPPDIYTIPPSCPCYYATHAYVYGATPDEVCVGYTPGYFGTCVCPEGTVVYGTGWPSLSWFGDSWFGGPQTYGWGTRFGRTGFGFGRGRPWGGPIGWHAGRGGAPWRPGWESGLGGRYATAPIHQLNFANVNIYHRWNDRVLLRTASREGVQHQGLNNGLAGLPGQQFRPAINGNGGQWPALPNSSNPLHMDWAAPRFGGIQTGNFQARTGFSPAPIVSPAAPLVHPSASLMHPVAPVVRPLAPAPLSLTPVHSLVNPGHFLHGMSGGSHGTAGSFHGHAGGGHVAPPQHR